MDERIGAYIIDTDGKAVPDLNDEAMSARQEPEAQNTKHKTQNPKLETQKDMEVKKDA